MEQVTAFKASDGSLFETASECERHQSSLDWGERIEEFMDSEYFVYNAGSTAVGMCKKVISGWESFKRFGKT